MIDELEDNIRDYINKGRVQSILLKDSATWNKLCSALDLVGDTQYALESRRQFNDIEDSGASYLIIYGVLQALLLQQDAVKQIADALSIKTQLPKELNEVRIIRNSAAGHPTNQQEKGVAKSCFIVRMSICPNSFEMMTVYSDDREADFSSVSISKLIELQNGYLIAVLTAVVKCLEEKERKHFSMHSNVKLVEILSKNLDYSIGKVLQACHDSNSHSIGLINLKLVKESILQFKGEIVDRAEWEGSDTLQYHYDHCIYAIEKVETYLSLDSELNQRDAYINASFFKEQIQTLRVIAKEIDEEYERSQSRS